MTGTLLEVPAALLDAAGSPLSQDAGDFDGSRVRLSKTGIRPWDKVLGGFALGSSVVVYGDAGARKTTWVAAVADSYATARGGRALFLSAEMPALYVVDCVRRLRKPVSLSILGSEADVCSLDLCLAEVLRLRPAVVVYDSIQSFDAGAPAGTDLAIHATVRAGRRFAAKMGHVALFISQVNKDGLPTGPNRSIHNCDVLVHVSRTTLTLKKSRFVPMPRQSSLLQAVAK